MSTNGSHDVVKNGTLDIVDKLVPTESGGHVDGVFEESLSGKVPDMVTILVGDDEKEKRQLEHGKLEGKDLANYVGATWERRMCYIAW